MAWPLTPLTTYVATTTPAIKAADLNSIQSAINGIYAATSSLAAVVVDGTGGATVTPVAGTLKLSAGISSTATPSSPAYVSGLVYKDMLPHAYGSVAAGGTAIQGRAFNVASVTNPSTGNYTVTMQVAAADTGSIVIANIMSGGTLGFITTGISGTSAITIQTFNNTGTASSSFPFGFVVFSG